jgi:phosphotransferase system enzyme I (PtsP)
MLEVPSVVDTIDELAAQADFLSIGSNDFVQYMLAADRGNEDINEYYQAHHPSVLRALGKMVRAANHGKVPISICGEMAQQPRSLPFLIGIGIRELSVAPRIRTELCKRIQTIAVSRATEHANQILEQTTVKGVEYVLDQWRDEP